MKVPQTKGALWDSLEQEHGGDCITFHDHFGRSLKAQFVPWKESGNICKGVQGFGKGLEKYQVFLTFNVGEV